MGINWEHFEEISFRYIWKVVELLTVIILARILDIRDFGAGFLIVTIYYFITSFYKIGFHEKSTAKIKKFFNTLSVAAPLFGILLAGSIFLFSLIYDSLNIRLLSILILLQSLTITPETFFASRNEYHKLYKSYAYSQIVMSIVAIVLAQIRFGYIAVISGYVMYNLTNALILWSMFPFKLKPKIDISIVKNIWTDISSKFFNYSLTTLLAYGVLLYSAITGIVNFAYLYLGFLLGFFLYENVTLYANSLLIRKFVELSGESFKYNFVRFIEYITYTIVPLSVILLVLLKEFIQLVLGTGWSSANDVLVILVIAGLLKGIFGTTRIVFIVKEKFQVITRVRVIELATLVVFLLILNPIGIYGIAFSILSSVIVSSVIYSLLLWRLIQLDLFVLSKEYFYILFAGVMTALFTGLLKEVFEIQSILSLFILIMVSLIMYVFIVFVFNKELYKRFVRFLFNLVEE